MSDEADAAAQHAAGEPTVHTDSSMSMTAVVSYLPLEYGGDVKPSVRLKIGVVEFGLLKKKHGIDIMAGIAEGAESFHLTAENISLIVYEAMRRRKMLPPEATWETFEDFVDEIELVDDDAPGEANAT